MNCINNAQIWSRYKYLNLLTIKKDFFVYIDENQSEYIWSIKKKGKRIQTRISWTRAGLYLWRGHNVTKSKLNMKQEGEITDREEVNKSRGRNRLKDSSGVAHSQNSLTKQEKLERRNAFRDPGGKRKEYKINCRNEQSRRYGMIVDELNIDIDDVVYDIQQGKLSLDALPKLGLYPLHEAVACGLTDCAENLIELGLQLTSETPDGLTPLEIAVMAGNFDAAALLIRYGAPIDRIRDGIPQFER